MLKVIVTGIGCGGVGSCVFGPEVSMFLIAGARHGNIPGVGEPFRETGIAQHQMLGSVEDLERNRQAFQNRGMWRDNATWLYKVDGGAGMIEVGVPDSPDL